MIVHAEVKAALMFEFQGESDSMIFAVKSTSKGSIFSHNQRHREIPSSSIINRKVRCIMIP